MIADPENAPADRLLRGVRRPVRLIHMICQMILGLGLAVALILKVYMAVLTDYSCSDEVVSLGNTIRCMSTLSLLAHVLALSAGFKLASLLFEDQVRRIMAPLLLGLGAGVLSVVDGILAGGSGWREALTIFALVACLAALLWLRVTLFAGEAED